MMQVLYPVSWNPLLITSSLPLRITTTVACNMDLTKYPMDKQTCTLQLESCKDTSHSLKKIRRLQLEAVAGLVGVGG